MAATNHSTVHVTDASFASEIEQANGLVLVDFWASWCGPCRMFAPIYEEASKANPDMIFASINTEEEQALASAAQVTSIPTLMAFKKGQLVFRQAGALPAPALEQLITAVRDFDVDGQPTD